MQEKGGKKIERDSIKLKDSLKELVSLDVEGVQDVPLTEMLKAFGWDFSSTPPSTRYTIYDELGRGGIGLVYFGIDQVLQREVALKVLRKRHLQNPAVVVHFLNEAKIMARLDHPGIVPIYDVGFLPNGELFFAMERIRGNTLRWYLDQRKTKSDIQKSLSELVPVFEQVCHIVAYAHSKQIVHRDLKPENIMIGPYRTVYVMDWGIARDLSKEGSSGTAKIKYLEHLQEALKSRRIKGTPRYMSPEQAIGIDDVDYRSDVFALGIIFYEILTGTHPFCDDEDDARQTLNKIKNQKPRPFPKTLWINGAWESICMKALQKLPNDRYPDAKPFADDIHRSLHYENVSVHQENLFSWGFRLIQRHRLLTLATLMSLLLLSIVSYHFLSGVHYSNTLLEMARQRVQYAKQCEDKIIEWTQYNHPDQDLKARQISKLRSQRNTLLIAARSLYCAALKKYPKEISVQDIQALKESWFSELQFYFQIDNLEGAREAFREMEREGYLQPQSPLFVWTKEELDRIQQYRKYLFSFSVSSGQVLTETKRKKL